MLGRERREGQQIGFGVGEELCGGGELAGELVDDAVELSSHLDGVRVGKDRAHEGCRHRLGGLRHPREEVIC